MDSLNALAEVLSALPAAVVAYSGGVDSALLADVAHDALGSRMLAVTAVSPSLDPEERAAAAALAAARGWAHQEVETAELESGAYRANAPDRCAHCKGALMDRLGDLARARGAAVLIGVNADDVGDYRPGMRAAAERGARAPLLEVGMTKDDVRAAARVRGLPVWDKPAAPCLASRIAYGIEVTPERLERIARAEGFVRALGAGQLRVRDHGDLARIEVPPSEVPRLADPAVAERMVSYLKDLGFHYVTLDLEGFRSGSLNAPLLHIGRRGSRNGQEPSASDVS